MKAQPQAESRLRIGFALDRRYYALMGAPQRDKASAILDVARVFERASVPYAIMGGVAVQIHTREPRTTLDLDIALITKDDIPVEALKDAGFQHEGSFRFSDNWRAPGPGPRRERTSVQFSADDLTAEAVAHAGIITLEGVKVSVVAPKELVALKVAVAMEPRRCQTRRIVDYADIRRLLEEHPELWAEFPGLQDDLDQIKSML